ncbi:MAG: hypothetical protein ACFCVD_08150 [Nodosilinea sp.]
MKNPSALGVSLLVLVAVTTGMGSSAANSDRSFYVAYEALSSILSDATVSDVIGPHQNQQVNTISLTSATLGKPHRLTITAPAATTLRGYIEINGTFRQPLMGQSASFDLSPFLQGATTHVAIVGDYTPATDPVTITFDGPDAMVQQQAGETGELDYQLNLVMR